MNLRDYQAEAVESIRTRWAFGERAILCAMPTGSGKTELGIALVQQELAAGGRALVVVDRKVLCAQWRDKMMDRGIDWVGILQGENTIATSAPALVGTAQTIRSRGVPEGVSLILIDESHIWHQTHDTVLENCGDAKVLGLTATPLRDGLGLRFESVVVGATVRGLIDAGYLVPARYYAPRVGAVEEALRAVSITAGDFNVGELSQAMRSKRIVGDVVGTWKRLGGDRQTIAFCVDKQHARDLVAEFRQEGVEAAVILDDTDDDARLDLLAGFSEGRVRVLASVGVLSVGFDSPIASCAILARPTLSLSLHIQQGGRVLRPYPGKTDALILDHAANVLTHGLLEDFVPPSDLSQVDKRSDRKRRDDVRHAWVCRKCESVNAMSTDVCGECGAPRRPFSTVVVLDGQLTRVDYENLDDPLPGPTPQSIKTFYGQCLWYASNRGMRPGWAYFATLRRFSLTSDAFRRLAIDSPPIPPDAEAARWIAADRQRSYFAWKASQGAA